MVCRTKWHRDIIGGKHGCIGVAFLAEVCQYGNAEVQKAVHDTIRKHGATAGRALWRSSVAEQPARVGGGSNQPFRVERITHEIAKPFIVRWHYSKNCPTGQNFFFGAFMGDLLYAVANYGIGTTWTAANPLPR